MPIVCQRRDGALQFDGTAGAGLFLFSQWDRTPRTTRVVLTSLAYHTADGGDPGDITFYAVRDIGIGDPLFRILLGRALSGTIVGPGMEGNARFCGLVLPRQPGQYGAQWHVEAFTAGKTVDAIVCVDSVLEPFPDGDERDSE